MPKFYQGATAKKFMIVPIIALFISCILALVFVFNVKLNESRDDVYGIKIEDSIYTKYMNTIDEFYNDIAKGNIAKFQEYSKDMGIISAWVLKNINADGKFIVLASSKYSDMIGKPVTEKYLSINKANYQSILDKGYYKNVKFLGNNRVEISHLKFAGDVIIGYSVQQLYRVSGIDDPYFFQWFLANMKAIMSIFLLMFILVTIQYLLFFRAIQDNQNKLESTNLELSEKKLEIERRLLFDTLTGLPNKFSLETDVENMKKPKIVVVDIDDFRKMNNYFGTRICNELLLYLTKLLIRLAENEGMKAYRLGADQFALVEDGDFFIDRYEELAISLIDSLKGIVIDIPRSEYDKKDLIEMHCTIGFALEEEDTLKKAMVALEYAKSIRKDYFCYLKNIDDTVAYVEQVKRSNVIRDAIINDRIIPYYQPIFDKDRNIIKHEALMRIKDSNEIVSPGVFLAVSKHIKRYVIMEKILIEKTFKLILESQKHTVAINLSGTDMTDGDVSAFIVEQISRFGIADRLVVEILEDENIENIDRIIKFIERVRRMGVKIALDDFGSGYSNFSNILKIKPDYIKIDGSIIKNIDENQNSRSVAAAIVAFCKQLDIKTVAEYVHSKNVFDVCVEIGIDEFQGFYLGEPTDKLFVS